MHKSRAEETGGDVKRERHVRSPALVVRAASRRRGEKLATREPRRLVLSDRLPLVPLLCQSGAVHLEISVDFIILVVELDEHARVRRTAETRPRAPQSRR